MTRVHCPDVRSLQTLLEEGRSGSETNELVHHLEACDDCQQALDTLTAEPSVWKDAVLLSPHRGRRPPCGVWSAD